MKTKKGYLPEESLYPIKGLNTFDPSVQCDPHMSPNCLNIELIKGEIGKRMGYALLGDSMTDPVIGIVEFQAFGGTKTLLAFTTKKQYKYDTSSHTWTNITYQTGGPAADVDWTGDETNTFDWCITSGKNASGTYTTWIIITNGKDQPRYWDGAASKFALFAPTGISNFKTCKTLIGFNDHLLLGNLTYTSGSPNPNLILWSETQELTKFADVTNGTGAALMTDIQGEIQKFVPLGDLMEIYCDNTIHNMTYVQGNAIFTFQKVLSETRLVSARSIVNIGPFHLFLSQENITYFDGTKLWGQIGNRIYRSYRNEFSAGNRHMAFAFHDVAKIHAYFNYPTSSTEAQMYKTEYQIQNITESNWTRIKYSDRAVSMGTWSRDANLTYDSAYLTNVKFSGLNMSFAQGSVKGAFPVRVFGTSDGHVALCDDTVPNDNTVAFESYWDTIDFTIPQEYQSAYARWIEIELDLKGFEVDVYTSVDQGSTYQFVQKINLSSEYKWYIVPIDVYGRTLRIRLYNNCPSSSFAYRDIRVWLKSQGPQ